MKIGIFDSGIGGLSIAKKVFEEFSSPDIYYLADKKYAPYGELSESAITQRVVWCGRELAVKGVELIIVACNTATAAGIELLRKDLNIPVIGLEPDINFYLRENLTILPEEICVLCTNYTLNSSKFKSLKAKRDPEDRMHYIGMKNLARLVEESFWEEFENKKEKEQLIIQDLTDNLEKNKYKYVVLGCTHYELISDMIESVTLSKTIGVGDAIARRCEELIPRLKNKGIRVADSCRKFFFMDSLNETWKEIEFHDFLSWP